MSVLLMFLMILFPTLALFWKRNNWTFKTITKLNNWAFSHSTFDNSNHNYYKHRLEKVPEYMSIFFKLWDWSPWYKWAGMDKEPEKDERYG